MSLRQHTYRNNQMVMASCNLPELIESLKQNGFKLTTSETLDATRLMVQLSRIKHDLSDEQLKDYLKPVLCKVSDKDSQRRFDEIFDTWYRDPITVSTGLTSTEIEQRQHPGKPPLDKNKAKILLLFFLIILNLVIAITSYQPKKTESQITQPITTVDNHVKRIFTLPPKQKGTGNHIAGYWPAYRYNEELRPGLAWFLVSAPLSIFAFIHLPALVLSRRRGRLSGQINLDGWGRKKAAERLVLPLPELVAGQFGRHFRGPATEWRQLARRPAIDIRRSVEATLNKYGIPQLRFRHAYLRPSYLVLVEAKNDDALAVLWAERFKKLGIDADIRRFSITNEKQEEAPDCYVVGNKTSTVAAFDNLPNPPLGQRLVLVSDGACLLDSKGEWRTWALATKLERWPVRVLFSPREPRDMLSGRLEKLDSGIRPGDPGFLVLPQEESALAAWSTWLATGRFPPFQLAEAQRYPRLLADKGEQRYLSEADDFAKSGQKRPTAREINRLVSELNIYLGENGFYWLCCCAVPPRMDNVLTLLLGEEYLYRTGVRSETKLRYHLQRNYRLLARLPWIRHNHIPDWLRLAFLARLTPDLQEEIRTVVESLLARQKPNLKGEIPLAFGLPEPGIGGSGIQHQDRDILYVGFMSGLSPQELTLRMPGQWRSWLSELRAPGKPPNRLKAWLSALTARLLFWQGLPAFGIASANLKLAGLAALVPVLFLFIIGAAPANRWPQTLRQMLFSEQWRPLLMAHSAAVNCVAFSPDGKRIVSGSDDKTLRLWDAATGQALGQPLKGHESYVESVAFSPDGKRIVSGSYDNTLRLWDAETGKALGQPLKGHAGYVLSVAFSPDGKRIVSGSDDKTLRLWDAATGQALGQPLKGHEGYVSSVAFSPDGRRIVSGSGDKTLRLWDAETGKALGQPLKGHGNSVWSVAFSPDGRRIVSGSNDNTLRLWDAATGAALGQPLKGHEDDVTSVAFSPDGERIVSGSNDNTLRLWDAATGKALGQPLKGHEGDIISVAFSPDGKVIVSGSYDRTLRLWDTSTGQVIDPPLKGHEDIVFKATYNPDGKLIATASEDKTARLWKVSTGKELLRLNHDDAVYSSNFSPDGKLIVTASRDKTARVWDVSTGKELSRLNQNDAVLSADFSPDGKLIVSTSNDYTSRLWDVSSGKEISRFTHAYIVNSAYFSPDGKLLVTASEDKYLRGFDTTRGLLLFRLKQDGAVNTAKFSPDGRLLATAGKDHAARVFDVDSMKELYRLDHNDGVNTLNFSPDSRRLVTVNADGTARLFNITNGEFITELNRLGGNVFSASFSPDGTRIISINNDDHTLRLWDGSTGQPVGLINSTGKVFSVSFSPNNDKIVFGGENGYLRQWRLPPYPYPDAKQGYRAPTLLNGIVSLALAGMILLCVLGRYIVSLRSLRKTVSAYQS